MVAPHNVGGAVSTAAALHLMATLRNGKILEHFNDFADAEVKAAAAPYPEVIDGSFALPQGPGWGVALDLDFIASRPPKLRDGVIVDPGLNLFENPNWAHSIRAVTRGCAKLQSGFLAEGVETWVAPRVRSPGQTSHKASRSRS
jgi:hypothetical protein